MITLLTGVPGSGKTAYLVDTLIDIAKDRPIYASGLDGLKIPHTPIDPERWHLDLPDGAVMVVDEVQKVWRPRGPSQAPSQAVKELEEHRHRGVDIYLTTQRPNLCDANVRGLVGRHVHFRDTGWLGRHMYEWPECSENLAWKTCHTKRKYKLPKRAFEFYKSASVHTKPVRGRSPLIWLCIVLLICVSIFGALLYRSLSRSDAPAVPPPSPAASAPVGGLLAGGQRAPGQAGITAASLRAAMQPRLTNVPETAPRFDEIRKVQRMQRVIGGYCRDGEGCRCFDQDGLNPGLTQKQCYEWIKSPPFDVYRTDGADAVADRFAPFPARAASSS